VIATTKPNSMLRAPSALPGGLNRSLSQKRRERPAGRRAMSLESVDSLTWALDQK
jgi:hypothetical protein